MLLEDTPAVLSLGKLFEDHGKTHHWTSGQKPHLIKNGRKFNCNTANYVPFVVPGLSTSSSTSSSPTSPTSSSQDTVITTECGGWGRPVAWASRNRKTPKNDDDEELQSDQLQDVPDWLQEFRHGLVDESVPVHRDASSSFHELLLEPRAKVVSGKHSILTHSSKDRNCDICLRTRITRASCKKRTGTVVPREENFGDSIIVDHKVLGAGCGSRFNDRYAVVVQDLATQWLQSYPCKAKTSQETQKSLQKFLEPTRKPKVIYADSSLECGKSSEALPWNHCTSTPQRSETNGIAERAVRRIKEATSSVLLQSGPDGKWWADSMECYCYLRDSQDLLSDGKTPYGRRFGVPFNGLVLPFRSNGRISPYFCEWPI